MFSEKLIELRKKNKDTQESLAKQLHVSRSLIAKWEQGRAYPNMEYVEKIAEFYNVSINEVVDKKELRNEFDKTVTKNKILKLSLFSILSLVIILVFLIPFFVTNEKYSEYYTEVVMAFNGCNNLTKFVWEESEGGGASQKLWSYTFDGCDALKELHLSGTVDEVSFAVSGDWGDVTVYAPLDSPAWQAAVDEGLAVQEE